MVSAANFQYERPPVRTVNLTIYFETLSGFGLPEMTRLHEMWGEQYPSVRHMPRKYPRDDGLPRTAVFGKGGLWQWPFVEYTDRTLTKTVGYQADRLILSWSFGSSTDSARAYPGFGDLSGELLARFDEFRAIVDGALDRDLVVQACRCEYGNTLVGISSKEWTVGYLTGWSGTTTSDISQTRHFNLAMRDDDEIDRVRLLSDVSAERQSTRGTKLSISVIAVQPTDDPLDVRNLMGLAHDQLIDKFNTGSSESMKAEWGKRES